jgi:translation elongation factor Ts
MAQISMQQVKELRDRTQAGLNDCKGALQEAEGDMDKAVEIILKKGLAKSAKRAGAVASEGQVATRLAADGKSGVIAEVNIQTDFAARNPDFVAFVDGVLATAMGAPTGADLSAQPFAGGSGTLEETRKALVGKLGENISVRRWDRVAVDGDGKVFSYVHMGGKVGVLVGIGTADAATVAKPEVVEFAKGIESSVVHYGDITPTFLNGLYRNDRAGVGLTYISAIAVEEKSIIDYNTGNPDGILDPGEQPRKPRVPLVAVYPKDGTLFSDNPFFVLDAQWVTAAQKRAARQFESFVQQPENQRKVLKFGFRPGNPSVQIAAPINAGNGLDPAQPQTTLGVPAPDVLSKLLDKWGEQRKAAKVLLVIDVSGSMGEEVGGGDTKLDLAKRASIDALDEFKPEDQVGLRIFSTNISTKDPRDFLDLVPLGEISGNREAIAAKIGSLVPTEGTPLYTTATASFEFMKEQFDPTRINAVVLLTDGRNEDDFNDLNATIAKLRAGSEGQSSQPVRLFTIAYGQDADKNTLKRLSEATNASTYDASDPQSINKVFTAVVSNF